MKLLLSYSKNVKKLTHMFACNNVSLNFRFVSRRNFNNTIKLKNEPTDVSSYWHASNANIWRITKVSLVNLVLRFFKNIQRQI